MLTWIKSLFSDLSAGSVLVVAATALVVSLMVALGQIASLQPDRDVLTVASDESVILPVSGQHGSVASESPRAVRSSVSVMVPVNTVR